MAYDASLDQELFAKAWENEAGRLVVGVYSEELQGILPLLQEALGQLG